MAGPTSGPVTPPPPTITNPKVAILNFGQSVQLGSTAGVAPAQEYAAEFPNVYYGDNLIQYGVNYDGVLFGPDLSLAKEFSEKYPNGTLYMEKEAVSGVGLSNWDDPTEKARLLNAYGALRQRVANVPNCKVIFNCIHGTNAAIHLAEAETYYQDFDNIVSELETAHGSFDNVILNYLGDIPPAMHGFWVREQCIQWVSEHPYAVGFDLNKYQKDVDQIHYTEQSNYDMGKDLLDTIIGLH